MLSSNDTSVMIVTGASKGIGLAVVRAALEKNYRILAVYRSLLSEELMDLSKRHPKQLQMVQADLALREDVDRIFTILDRTWGRLDCLVNNAGNPGERASLTEMDDRAILKIVNDNLLTTILMTKGALTFMKDSGSSIINMSSAVAASGGFRLSVYAAAKAAISAFTSSIAREAAEQGIRVNAVMPGVIDTGVHADEDVARQKAAIPMGRMGRPEEVACAILWLASDEASYINGAVLPIDGAK